MMKELNRFLFYFIVALLFMIGLSLFVDLVYAENSEVVYTSIHSLKQPDVIPEPSSLVMLLSGIGGLFMIKKVG